MGRGRLNWLECEQECKRLALSSRLAFRFDLLEHVIKHSIQDYTMPILLKIIEERKFKGKFRTKVEQVVPIHPQTA